MGRPRKPEGEKVATICINLKQKIIDRIAEEGEPKKVIEAILKQQYDKPPEKP